MYRQLTCLSIVLMSALLAGAQQKPAAKPATPAATATKARTPTNLPSEEVVNAFLTADFRLQPSIELEGAGHPSRP